MKQAYLEVYKRCTGDIDLYKNHGRMEMLDVVTEAILERKGKGA